MGGAPRAPGWPAGYPVLPGAHAEAGGDSRYGGSGRGAGAHGWAASGYLITMAENQSCSDSISWGQSYDLRKLRLGRRCSSDVVVGCAVRSADLYPPVQESCQPDCIAGARMPRIPPDV